MAMYTPDDDAVIKAKASDTPGKTLMKAETQTTIAETMMAREGIPLRDKVSSFKAFMTLLFGVSLAIWKR